MRQDCGGLTTSLNKEIEHGWLISKNRFITVAVKLSYIYEKSD